MIRKIAENIWGMNFELFGSCVYLIKLNNRKILIDTSTLQNRNELIRDLKSINLIPRDIDFVFLTHGHFDHIENIEIFTNAEFFGSKKDFENCDKIKDIRGQPFYEIKLIETPGHTIGSICFYMPKEKILFSGDTLFHNGNIGRTDFPNSSLKDMRESLKELEQIDYKVLCPGHDD
jgi:hydroxyacylglutathione hydrolase